MKKVGGRETWMDELEDVGAEAMLEAEFAAIEEDAEDYGPEDYDPEEEFEEYDEEEFAEEPEENCAEVWIEGEARAAELARESQYEVVAIPREILAEFGLPKLPTGVAVTGGVARSVAREVLAKTAEPVRALELTFVPELCKAGPIPSDCQLEELSKTYMADDYIYGRGVRLERLEDYFLGRDFTVDQCLIYDEKLMLTRAAQEDLQAGVIRPTYGAQPGTETLTSERDFLRALLMQATLAAEGAEAQLADFTLDEISREIDEREYDGNDLRLGAFSIALTLNKALSRGAEVAHELVDIFVENGIVDERFAGRPLALARKVRDECPEFEYRPLEDCPDDDPEYDGSEEDFLDAEWNERAAKTGSETEIEEIKTGFYTADDYDWINRAGPYA